MPPPDLPAHLLTELEHQARSAAALAYAPYSHFHVGAALLLDGPEAHIVTGCNVENASYRLTTCAEQTAITRAVATFGPGIRLRAILVLNPANQPCQPCGACRQTIAEFSSPDTPVYFPDSAGKLTHLTVSQLLPASFSLAP